MHVFCGYVVVAGMCFEFVSILFWLIALGQKLSVVVVKMVVLVDEEGAGA